MIKTVQTVLYIKTDRVSGMHTVCLFSVIFQFQALYDKSRPFLLYVQEKLSMNFSINTLTKDANKLRNDRLNSSLLIASPPYIVLLEAIIHCIRRFVNVLSAYQKEKSY